MAGEFHKLEVKRYPKAEKRETSDSKYWKKFNFPIVSKENGAVTYINFSQVKPYNFAVTSASRVQIYSSITHQVTKTISRFSQVAYSGCFRNDGQLLVAGGEDGLIQLFDLNSRAILRKFKGHQEAVHVTKFLKDNLNLVSASDDKVVKCWDISTEQHTVSYQEHEDYIRTGDVSQTNKDVFITGSYDHTIRMWDKRQEKSIMSLDHGAPVECVRMHPSGGMCISAGSNFVRVWDILSGGRLVTEFSNHQKTVTSLCFDGETKRLLSGALDKKVKVYDLQDYKVVHSLDYPSPILSIGISPDDRHLVVGMTDGLLSIKYQEAKKGTQPLETNSYLRPGTSKFFKRGRNFPAQKDDFVITEKKRKQLGKFDRLMKEFEYSKVLDEILKPLACHPPVAVAIIQELNRRGALKRALSGRDEETLAPILYFLIKHISNPRYSTVLIDVANIVLDMYISIIGQSKKIDDLFFKLRTSICSEIRFTKQAFELLGAMDTLFEASSGPLPSTQPESNPFA